ncbi:MAG: hypothetical protein AAFW81_03520 [Pseudomonadota bacterium]
MCVDALDKNDVEKPKNDGRLRVAVAGLGLIGEGAALRLVAERERYDFCGALVRDTGRERAAALKDATVTDEIDALLSLRPDIVIDALPSGDVGRTLIGAALQSGVGVVTANKQAIAGSMAPLTMLAGDRNAYFAYGASVGGGAPMIETVRSARREGDVGAISAILNGTVNYILTALQLGDAFDDAVAKAQQAGFAEPDPTADLSGEDARAKLAILSFEALGAEAPESAITVEALTRDKAQEIVETGGVWRQMSTLQIGEDGALRGSVALSQIDASSTFAHVIEEENALQISLRDGRRFECKGKGAGRAPTVGSLFDDLATAAARRP